MKVRYSAANGASYAIIDMPGRHLSVKLRPDTTSGSSMRLEASEMRQKAEKLIERADIIEAASYLI